MVIRLLKIVLVVFVGLQGWFYVAGNIANWDSGLNAVGYVLAMDGHEVYGNHIFPAVTNPVLVIIAFLTILSGEFLIGALSLTGAWHLWRVRHGDADSFNSAKTFAILGAGTAMVLWFGGFVVMGGGLFQMWRTPVGASSFEGAFIYAATSALVLLFVNNPDR